MIKPLRISMIRTTTSQLPTLSNDLPIQKKPKQSQEKSLEDWLGEPDKVENPAHKLEVCPHLLIIIELTV